MPFSLIIFAFCYKLTSKETQKRLTILQHANDICLQVDWKRGGIIQRLFDRDIMLIFWEYFEYFPSWSY